MERDIEKDLIEIECAIKSHREQENIFSMSVLQRCYKLVSDLKEYRDLEEQGKLLKLPCKVGDTVYKIQKCLAPNCEACKAFQHRDDCFTKYKTRIIKTKFSLHHFYDFGKTVFTTQDESEAVLKEIRR